MNKNLLILFCLFSLMQVSRAQDPIFGEPQHSTLSADSLSDVVGLIPESLDANVDSLLHSWHVQYFSKVDEYCHDDAENVYFPDSVYEERLERLPSVIRLPYNEVVRDCIDLYAGRKRDLVRYMLGMADFYFPIIEQVLDKHNLPLELKYLAVVESARYMVWRSTACWMNGVIRRRRQRRPVSILKICTPSMATGTWCWLPITVVRAM